MTLRELGNEYLREAKTVRERIKTLRAGMDKLKEKRRKELEKRIFSLYSTACEAESTGKHLIGYYEEDAAH